jgi:ribosomal protein L22
MARKKKDAEEPETSAEGEATPAEDPVAAEKPTGRDADESPSAEKEPPAAEEEPPASTEPPAEEPAAEQEPVAKESAEEKSPEDGSDPEESVAAAKAAAKEASRPKRRRGAAETTTRKEPARPAPRREDDGVIQVRAQARYVRSAPRKARLVMNHIRGKRIDDARAILRHTPRAAAGDIAKLLESAVANAENNFELDPDDLKIDRAFVDEGPTIKRFRPRALGRATPIHKRTSHMTITLTMEEGK